MIRVTRKYGFCASHRLYSRAFSEETNQALYGKCANPYGHGHNYELEVSVRGPLDPRTGRAVDPDVLDRLVQCRVVAAFDHRDLNREEAFRDTVPTTEALSHEILRRLSAAWSEAFPGGAPRLEKVRIAETRKNAFEVLA